MIRVPPTIPADTTAEVAARQRASFAQMDPMERVAAALDLSETVRELQWMGLKHRHSRLPEGELRDKLLDLCYGGSELR